MFSIKAPVQALDRWEERLENIWEGRPYDILDAALADTVSRFPVHIQPFRDMIGGMRIDLVKSRYETFDELYEYMYRCGLTHSLTPPGSVPWIWHVARDDNGAIEDDRGKAR